MLCEMLQCFNYISPYFKPERQLPEAWQRAVVNQGIDTRADMKMATELV